MLRRYLFLLSAITIIGACGPDTTTIGGLVDKDTTSNGMVDDTLDSEDDAEYDNIIESFSNPIEMANLVKDVGVPFSRKYLCSTDDVDRFDTEFKKALALGMYSADLGYLNIYAQNMVVVDYLTAINRLADDLKVGKHFNFNKLKTLAQSSENIDSLLFHSVQSFNDMDIDLKTHGRSNLSTLVVTGVWIEGLYLATQVYKETTDPQVGERVGEQQIVLNELYAIIEKYKSDPDFSFLVDQLNKLTPLYEQVTISVIPGPVVKTVVDGRVLYEQGEESIVEVSSQVLAQIVATAEEVRNNLQKY